MSRIILIPGLGADQRVFSRIGELPAEKLPLDWLPVVRDESFPSYCQRLIDQYGISSSDHLAGLSFGGLVAQQIAAMNGNAAVILISSFRDSRDLKWLFRGGLKSGAYRLVKHFRFKATDSWAAAYLNSGNKESKPLLQDMLQKTDPNLFSWSLHQIAKFKQVPDPGFKIHSLIGNRDRIVKMWDHEHQVVIDGGSHFMVYDQAEAITKALNSLT